MEERASPPAWSERSSTARQALAASEKSAELTLGQAGEDARLSIELSMLPTLPKSPPSNTAPRACLRTRP
jgi:hypothetical protein